MSPKTTIIVVAALFVALFGRQFFHEVPVGHVGVATFLNENGLEEVGNSYFRVTGNSGTRIFGAAGANGAGGVEISESHALCGEPIDIWRHHDGITVGCQIAVPQIIGQKNDKIGALL